MSFGRCKRCKRWKFGVKWRLMNTAYVDESDNWCQECPKCFQQTQEYWAGMWRDYYSG